jgi:putative endopeptidase
MSRTEMRDPEKRYHIYTVADFEELARLRLGRSTSRPSRSALRHAQRGHAGLLQGLNDLIETEPVDAWKAYFRWHTCTPSATNLPKAFFDENFAFFGKTLPARKSPPRAGSSAPQ